MGSNNIVFASGFYFNLKLEFGAFDFQNIF